MVAMRLRLQEAYTRVELGRDVEILVVRWHDTNESGLVRTDLGYVAVAAVAELRMAIAPVLRLSSGPMECLIDLSRDGDHGVG